jgi:hypothetical protein
LVRVDRVCETLALGERRTCLLSTREVPGDVVERAARGQPHVLVERELDAER